MASPAPASAAAAEVTTASGYTFTRVETVVVSTRVTGQRVELIGRNFGSGHGGGGDSGPVFLPPDVVRDLLDKNAQTPIVALVIRACKLDALPRELSQLKFLHELDVSDNALADLPVDLLALTNLAKLNLSGNKFKELPVFIGHLSGLLHLQVLNMPTLTSLPFNVMRNGTEAICAYLRSALVVIEEKQEELELNVRELLNKDKHADIVFVVEDQHIFAHRLIVALRIASPVISAILASPNREHRVVGVGADVFLQLLRFAYGNGLYQLTSNQAFDQAFMRMLDALQVTTFGRNQKLPGTRTIVKRSAAMMRDDFARLFDRITNPSSPPAPSSPKPCSDFRPQPEAEAEAAAGAPSDVNTEDEAVVQPKPRDRRRKGRQKRETRAERQMREAEENKTDGKREMERVRQLELEMTPLLNEELLLRNDFFADLHIRSPDGDEKLFACHKFLLCVRSPYFQAKFESGMADALDKRITIDGFSHDIVVQLLRAMYTDDVEVNADNAQDLLDLSGQYQLERLRSVVEKFFGDMLEHDNVLSVLHMADHYQAYNLKLFCTSHILKHREAVMAYSDEWRSFRKEHPELFSQLNRLLNA